MGHWVFGVSSGTGLGEDVWDWELNQGRCAFTQVPTLYGSGLFARSGSPASRGKRNPGGPQSVLYAPTFRLARKAPVPTRLCLRQGRAELSSGCPKLTQR